MLTIKSILNKIIKTSFNKINLMSQTTKGKKINLLQKVLLTQKLHKFNSLDRRNKFNFSTKISDSDIQTIKFSISFPKQLKSEDFKIAESIRITESCIEKINELVQKKNIPNLFLRVMVEGGGCSGFQYIFKMDEVINREEDLVFNVEDKNKTKVVIDKISLPFLEGAIIDYKETMMKSSFYIRENPKAEISCSCGTSFSPKLNKI